MNKRKFLEKARNKHGYKYYYINLPDNIYINDIIDISYKDMNYKQRVKKHLEGKCPEKQMTKLNLEEFIKRSIDIWGNDRFDYSTLEYHAMNKPIKIFDKKVNMLITQYANAHLNGHENKIWNTDILNFHIDNIHKGTIEKYNNSISGKNDYIRLNCKEHGEFTTKVSDLLSHEKFCKKCNSNKLKSEIEDYLINLEFKYIRNPLVNSMNIPYNGTFDFFIKKAGVYIDVFDNTKLTDEARIIIEKKIEFCEDNFITYYMITDFVNWENNLYNILYKFI